MRQCIQLLCSLLLWWATGANAIELSSPQRIQISDVILGRKVLDSTVEVWERGTANENPLEVAAVPGGEVDGFRTVSAKTLDGRFDMKNLWLRLTLHNDLATPQALQLALGASWLQHVSFYVLRMQEGQVRAIRTLAGISDPNESLARVPQIAINLAPGETLRVLVHVNSHASSKLEVTLHTVDQWHMMERDYALFSGLLIGSILVFVVYSAALWRILRASMMGWQTLGLLLTALYEATYRGYAQVILWPSSTQWGYRAHHVLVAGIVLSILLYLRARLEKTPEYLPSAGVVMLKFIALLESMVLVGALWGPYDWFAPVGIIVAPLSLLTILACTYIYHRNGGPGGMTALLLVSVLAFCALLRAAALLVPNIAVVQLLEQYALVLPALTVGLFVITSWAYQHSHQRHQAQRTLLQWQSQQQERLEHEVDYKTRALKEALEQAEQRSLEQKELLAYVSHDLRAPVSAIIAYLQLMHRSPNKVDPDKLAAIERSAAYQLALIDELVDYAKDELQPPLALNEQSVDLSALLNDLTKYAQALAHRQRNAFSLQIQSLLPAHIYLDGKRLQQAVLNLLSNAAKFTFDGNIDLKLQAKYLGREKWHLRFEVSDSGSGIDEEVLAGIQKSLAANRTHSKRGLGLLIAQRIIEKMTGHLSIDSRPGRGTNAVFFLMVKQVSNSPLFQALISLPASDRGHMPEPMQKLEALPKKHKDELERLARHGNWSDLHFWIDAMDNGTDYPVLIKAVRQALDDLDFEQIGNIARSAPLR
ncbi:sensor histidine kinase [Comamonas testosteroni]|uniref:sensor histidine kinase n=1 Tax=Comamonas testosteroni TaxID=285 RepID=UPI003899E25A